MLARKINESMRDYAARSREAVHLDARKKHPHSERDDLYVEALMRLSVKHGGSWVARYDAVDRYSPSPKRFSWYAWIEREAQKENSPQWCKLLVAETVAIRLGA